MEIPRTSDRTRTPAGRPLRVTIGLGAGAAVDWAALRREPRFLFRHVGDAGRSLLFVGELAGGAAPLFGPDGSALDWYYGHLCYDLKNELEALRSRHPDPFGMPVAHWSVPRWVVEWRDGRTSLHVPPHDREQGLRFCEALLAPPRDPSGPARLHWQHRTSRDRYMEQARHLLGHIRRGDIYEVNLCTERRAHAPGFDPFSAFASMWERGRPPFAAFHRMGDRFALCASPERFLAFEGDRVTGQPMKGTRPRSADPVEDARLAAGLAADPKERSENIMALDVMRHDLSRVAAQRSVTVEELCAVRAHARVHQMTSTVAARLRPGLTPMDAVYAAFPMASMTGAPKLRAMQLIDEVEDQRRGLFSGTLGFFAPDGTADLNVVIRTVLHDAATGLTSLSTGSALTAACDPQQEWEECEVKARSVIEALEP